MANDFAIANELAIRAAATWPRTTYFTTNAAGVAQPSLDVVPPTMVTTKVTDAPANVTDGLALPDKTMAALIGIDMRENIAYRTVRISIADFDAAREYTIDIDATGSVSTASQPYADAQAALTAIKAVIDADSPGLADLVTTSVVEAPNGSGDYMLVLTGKAEADYSITTLSASAGSNVLDMLADAVSLEFQLYVMRGGVNSSTNPQNTKWRKVPLPLGANEITVADYKGYEDRYDVAGLQRLYMEVDNVAGAASEVAAGATVNSVTYAYSASAGIAINNGDT